MEIKKQQRSTQQNKALHKHCDLVAKECNEIGFTYSEYIRQRPKLEMPWTMERVKDLWRTAAYHMYGHTSTSQITTDQIDKIYDVVNKAIAEITGVHVPFPSIEEYDTE